MAAGSLVAGDVARYTLVGGVPAKYIRDRSRDLRYRRGRTQRKRFV